ncbi:DUF5004 domain-containing protein [Mucilaginibacter glaciei]|uniref:Lipocalin-like domain-containing protein n=1 Tax=Mucilaginibacter glaciei TaxID=2772109 RepID=A0A926NPS5_9SPHI|nr:lipocalin family protein [Mucilaginibacter glaciei]MBD1393153.1 hypothetical protein [Mucilaginibacter glaciei]
MKNKTLYFLLTGVIAISFFINSCKKEDQSNIPNLLTTGVWQLATLTVDHYVGDSKISTDTLNTKCDTTQVLVFNKDNTLTYTNFDCRIQPTAKGNYSITSNRLYLNSNITVQDNTTAGKSQPFLSVQFVNLGQFSLVFNTGDLQTYYTAAQVRTIKRYGFIRQRTTSK